MSNSPAHLFVISAPSGAGKTTLVRALVERNPALRFSVSYTTRPQRETEVEGHDYFFVYESRFKALRASGELLESAVVFDEFRGEGVPGRSVAWRLVFRSPERTLRDEEVDGAVRKILTQLKEQLGVQRRET